jgi:hypothetical protein
MSVRVVDRCKEQDKKGRGGVLSAGSMKRIRFIDRKCVKQNDVKFHKVDGRDGVHHTCCAYTRTQTAHHDRNVSGSTIV